MSHDESKAVLPSVRVTHVALVDYPTVSTEEREQAEAFFDCKADVHFGPVTVSGRELRCSNCGYLWEIASEGPGPK